MKARVAPDANFGAIVREAEKICVVALKNEKRRFFVVECDNDKRLDLLRGLGCEITEDRSYDLDQEAGTAS
jgi:hypothetical protein